MSQCLTSQNVNYIIDNFDSFLTLIKDEDMTKLTTNMNLNILFESPNLFLQGNYLKYSWFLSQTPWEIDG